MHDPASGLFFDLQKEVTTNPEFIDNLRETMGNWYAGIDAGDAEAESKYMTDVIRMCDYNPSVTIPYFFPEFSRGKPMTLWTRPHAISMMSFVPNGSLVVNASRQIGKCCTGDTSVSVRDASGERKTSMEDLFSLCK